MYSYMFTSDKSYCIWNQCQFKKKMLSILRATNILSRRIKKDFQIQLYLCPLLIAVHLNVVLSISILNAMWFTRILPTFLCECVWYVIGIWIQSFAKNSKTFLFVGSQRSAILQYSTIFSVYCRTHKDIYNSHERRTSWTHI